ncbi:CpsD/CapB family tyrosine-protein kinase [Sphingomonas sp. LT1P40]|uniref:CpsD/CapB family tyrosine-protein kinase n=1 Tax=Alteristakelama amylovorans TaxID=3096166 RepID=UPI002FCA3D49
MAGIDAGLHPSEKFNRLIFAMLTGAFGVVAGVFLTPLGTKLSEDQGFFSDKAGRDALVEQTMQIVSQPGISATIGFATGVFLFAVVVQILSHRDQLRGAASDPIRSLEEFETFLPYDAVALPKMAKPPNVRATGTAFTEGISLIPAKLARSSIVGLTKILLVTSTGSNEGKTSTAAALAISYSRQQKRVALIDADMRRPHIHELFSLSNHKGLSWCLHGNLSIDDIMDVSVIRNLDILTSGPQPANPADLLESGHLPKLMEQLSKRYDVVVIDAPPVLRIADTIILSKYCDAVVYVVAADQYPIHLIARSIAQLRMPASNVIAALNRVRTKFAEFGYYRYGYGYTSSVRRFEMIDAGMGMGRSEEP